MRFQKFVTDNPLYAYIAIHGAGARILSPSRIKGRSPHFKTHGIFTREIAGVGHFTYYYSMFYVGLQSAGCSLILISRSRIGFNFNRQYAQTYLKRIQYATPMPPWERRTQILIEKRQRKTKAFSHNVQIKYRLGYLQLIYGIILVICQISYRKSVKFICWLLYLSDKLIVNDALNSIKYLGPFEYSRIFNLINNILLLLWINNIRDLENIIEVN